MYKLFLPATTAEIWSNVFFPFPLNLIGNSKILHHFYQPVSLFILVFPPFNKVAWEDFVMQCDTLLLVCFSTLTLQMLVIYRSSFDLSLLLRIQGVKGLLCWCNRSDTGTLSLSVLHFKSRLKHLNNYICTCPNIHDPRSLLTGDALTFSLVPS